MFNMKKFVGLILAVSLSVLGSVNVFAAAAQDPYQSYVPPEGYRGVIEYNSEGVPIIGYNYQPSDLPKGIAPRYSNYTSFNTVINGKKIPHASYPIGSIFSGTVDGSYECVAFAKFIYKYLWGGYSTGSQIGQKDTSTDTKAYNVIKTLKNGTRITGYDANGNQRHTMIIVRVTDSFVDVYHANYSTVYNQVNVTKFSYKEFASLFKSINGYRT